MRSSRRSAATKRSSSRRWQTSAPTTRRSPATTTGCSSTPSATAGSLAYRTDETPPINPLLTWSVRSTTTYSGTSRRNKEVSRYIEPEGIEQQEQPNQQHYARDQTNHPRAYPRKEGLDPDHDPLVVD